MPKPKVAFYWCASCGGCEEAVVDLAEDILKVTDAVDIAFWPVALDIKKKDVESMPDSSIAVTFVNGAIRTSEHEEMAKLLRKKSGLIVAFGSCAHLGGVPALANLKDRDAILGTVYCQSPSTLNPEKVIPREKTTLNGDLLTLPNFFDHVYALDEIIDVDYYLPGCSVPTKLLMDAVTAILSGQLPPKGTVLAPKKTLCDTCERNASKPEKLTIESFHRPYEVLIDPEKCLLPQGIVCMGPVTRGGCGERCIKGNMPCGGCMGPVDGVRDQGAKFISALASLFDARDDKGIEKIVETIPDPAGTFYRYSLSKSFLKGRVSAGGQAWKRE